MRKLKYRVFGSFSNAHELPTMFYFNINELNATSLYKVKQYFNTLQQFTGLKDKTSKEIYEGDIIKFAGILYIIEYIESYGMYVASTKLNGISDPRTFYPLDFMKDLFLSIGNIYENPELLIEE